MRVLSLLCLLASLPSLAVAQVPALDVDRVQIDIILDNFEEAYGMRDSSRWVRHFAENADFMQAFGVYRRGRAAIEQFMTQFIEGQTEAMEGREISRRINFPAPGVAFAELTEEVTGIREADGREQPARRGHMMLVLVKSRDEWVIVHYRYLDIHSGPLGP